MKLKRYLTESTGVFGVIDAIEKDCKPYMKFLKSIKYSHFLIRDDSGRYDSFIKKKVRKDRRPSDSTMTDHKKMDEWLLNRFGWKARSEALFCYGAGIRDLSTFDYMVFPIGNFKFVWSPDIRDAWNYGGIDSYSKHTISEWYDDARTYTDKDLNSSVKSQSEIMVKCGYAWLLNTNNLYKNDFLDYLDIPEMSGYYHT